ncbi:hypothetical protein PO909_033079, partial [Leuciscus waleckii]
KTSTSVCVSNSIRALRTVHSVLLTLPSLQIDSGSLEMPKKMKASDWTICLFLLGSVTEFIVLASPEVNESQQEHPQNVYHDISVTRNQIVTAQFECYQKIMKDNNQDVIPSKAGPVCSRTWDGWLCWDDTEAGITSEQHCPDYFQDFDPTEPNEHWRKEESKRRKNYIIF